MRVKLFKKLNEELLENIFTVILPTVITVDIEIEEDEILFVELKEQIYNETVKTVYDFFNIELYPYLNDSRQDLEKQLNTSGINFSEIDIDIEELQDIPVMEGVAYFDVETDMPVDKGRTKQLFNTLINNNTIYKEFTLVDSDVDVILEKDGDIEVGEI